MPYRREINDAGPPPTQTPLDPTKKEGEPFSFLPVQSKRRPLLPGDDAVQIVPVMRKALFSRDSD